MMARDRLNGKPHTFTQKSIIKAHTCDPCGKRLNFGKVAAKCKDCHALVHTQCKDILPLPCIPVSGTPTSKGGMGVISDFTPAQAPMVPALLIHCINEVEARGLNEVGIYRIPGSECDVKALKERFLKQKGAPDLSRVDIHVICGCIKDFLRSLREPLVSPSKWSEFIRCVEPVEHKYLQAMSDDGFVFVKSRRRLKKNNGAYRRPTVPVPVSSAVVGKEVILQRLESAKQELLLSDYYQSFLAILRELKINEEAVVLEIICLGLGRFGECVCSRYQLALLLLLKDHWNIRVLVHDPLFNDTEYICLKTVDCDIITENEEGKRALLSGGKTFVCLPHCPKQLINNFLWSNWGENLSNCLLFANSFSKIIESLPSGNLERNAKYIVDIFPHVEEKQLVNSFRYIDVFNDLSIHTFPLSKLRNAGFLWNSNDEPKYCSHEIELILNENISSLKHLEIQ